MAEPIGAGKALNALRGQLREHLLGPLERLEQVLEAAARAEVDLGNTTARRAELLQEIAALKVERDKAEAEIEAMKAAAASAASARRDESAHAAAKQREQLSAEFSLLRDKAVEARDAAEREAEAAKKRLAELRAEHGRLLVAWKLEEDEARDRVTAARIETTAEREKLDAEVARLRAEHRAIVERIQKLLPGG